MEKTSINMRATQEFKDRWANLAFHDLSTNGRIESPDQVNLSEYLREMMEPLLERLENARGGADRLAQEADAARVAHHRAVLAQLERSLAQND